MFSYAGLAEVDMTKVTVALCYSGLTKVTSGHVLGRTTGSHIRSKSEKTRQLCFLSNCLFACVFKEICKFIFAYVPSVYSSPVIKKTRSFLCAGFDHNFLIFLPCQVNQLDEINTTDVNEQNKNPIKPQNYLNFPISGSNTCIACNFSLNRSLKWILF